jgi:hypothetical protein
LPPRALDTSGTLTAGSEIQRRATVSEPRELVVLAVNSVELKGHRGGDRLWRLPSGRRIEGHRVPDP